MPSSDPVVKISKASRNPLALKLISRMTVLFSSPIATLKVLKLQKQKLKLSPKKSKLAKSMKERFLQSRTSVPLLKFFPVEMAFAISANLKTNSSARLKKFARLAILSKSKSSLLMNTTVLNSPEK